MDNLDASARSLVKRYLDQTCTEEEKELVEDWYERLPNTSNTIREAEMEHDLRLVQHKLWQQRHPQRPSDLWRKIAAAAIIVLLLGGGIYHLANRPRTMQQVVSQDIDPGGYRATLTLGGGRKISLTDAEMGKLAWADGVQISKTADGQIVYQVKAPGVIHTDHLIEVPRGGEYQVVLPDGSHVWLNAGSSLKYPTRFTGTSRHVELSGEAYFEVSHQSSAPGKEQARLPFVVITAHQKIEVLGTRFNVSAYADDSTTKTTLLEGKIRVVTGYGNQQKKTTLYPGQLATLTSKGFQVTKTNTDAAIAWQRGYVTGYNMTFDELMKQLSRWYDFEYEGGYDDGLYTFSIRRNTKLSTFLQAIEVASEHITFHVENTGAKGGRKVHVTTNGR